MLAATKASASAWDIALALGPYTILTIFCLVYAVVQFKFNARFKNISFLPLIAFMMWVWLWTPGHTLGNFLPGLFTSLVGKHISTGG